MSEDNSVPGVRKAQLSPEVEAELEREQLGRSGVGAWLLRLMLKRQAKQPTGTLETQTNS